MRWNFNKSSFLTCHVSCIALPFITSRWQCRLADRVRKALTVGDIRQGQQYIHSGSLLWCLPRWCPEALRFENPTLSGCEGQARSIFHTHQTSLMRHRSRRWAASSLSLVAGGVGYSHLVCSSDNKRKNLVSWQGTGTVHFHAFWFLQFLMLEQDLSPAHFKPSQQSARRDFKHPFITLTWKIHFTDYVSELFTARIQQPTQKTSCCLAAAVFTYTHQARYTAAQLEL